MESKRCVLSLSCRSDGSTELAEVFAKSKAEISGVTALALRVMRVGCVEPSRQEARKTVVFGGGLEFSLVFV